MAFEATVQAEGSFRFVAVPFSPRSVWGSRRAYRVTGTINGIGVQGTLGAQKQDAFLRLSAAWLRDSGVQIGETVRVELSLAEEASGS